MATVSITVNAVNDAPTAATTAYSVDEDTTLTYRGSGVLGNDSDVDGDPLTAVAGVGPDHGTLTLNADGSFTYTPDANYHGSDTSPTRPTTARPTPIVATVYDHGQPGERYAARRRTTATAWTRIQRFTLRRRRAGQRQRRGRRSAVSRAGLWPEPRHPDAQRQTVRSPTRRTPTIHGADAFTYQGQRRDGRLQRGDGRRITRQRESNDAPVAADDSYSVNEDDDAERCRDRRAEQRQRRGRRPLTAVARVRSHARHPDAQRRRFVQLHAGRELPWRRYVHVSAPMTGR